MTSKTELLLILTVVGFVSSFSMISLAQESKVNKPTSEISPTVEIEEIVTNYAPANNIKGTLN